MGNSETLISPASYAKSSVLDLKTPPKQATNFSFEKKSSNLTQSTFEDEGGFSNYSSSFKDFSRTVKPRSFTSMIKNQTNNDSPSKISCNSFIIKKEIKKGKNSKGKLMMVVKKNHLNKNFVMFSIKKLDIAYSIDELETLKEEINGCENHFVSKIRYFFEKSPQVYFVQDYYEYSHLRNYLKKHGNLKENLVRFYAAEILVAFELLPKNQLLLNKFALNFDPKKVFFDDNGHFILNILSTVFKKDNENELNPEEIEYFAPEIVENKKFSIVSILAWKIGVLLYELASGETPFLSKYEILNKNLKFPLNFSQTLVDLIQKLLIRSPLKRLGQKSFTEIKNHEFFKEIDWEKIQNKEKNGPILKELNEENNLEIFSLKDILDDELSCGN